MKIAYNNLQRTTFPKNNRLKNGLWLNVFAENLTIVRICATDYVRKLMKNPIFSCMKSQITNSTACDAR